MPIPSKNCVLCLSQRTILWIKAGALAGRAYDGIKLQRLEYPQNVPSSSSASVFPVSNIKYRCRSLGVSFEDMANDLDVYGLKVIYVVTTTQLGPLAPDLTAGFSADPTLSD